MQQNDSMLKNQNRVVTLLPDTMTPSREVFESLGFVFQKTSKATGMFRATLPNGWEYKDHDDNSSEIKVGYLVDERGRIRGNCLYHVDICKGEMNLIHRYYISTIEENDLFFVCVKDAETELVVFEGGRCKEDRSTDYHSYRCKCQNFLSTKYPRYADPLAYWD